MALVCSASVNIGVHVSLWRTVWRFLKKLKIELTYNPTSPLLGIYMGKTIIQKGI